MFSVLQERNMRACKWHTEERLDHEKAHIVDLLNKLEMITDDDFKVKELVAEVTNPNRLK